MKLYNYHKSIQTSRIPFLIILYIRRMPEMKMYYFSYYHIQFTSLSILFFISSRFI
jgi:hypothetical protein